MALIVVSSAFLLAATGCKKSNSSNPTGSMSASVNGTAWVGNVPSIGLYSIAAGEFELEGSQLKSGDTTALALAFFTPFVVNRAFSSDTASVDVGYIDSHTLNEYDGGNIAGHSVVTITSYDSTGKKIAGTFSGVLYNISGGTDSLVITGGVFNSTYTAQ
jgi:hypothetical protein